MRLKLSQTAGPRPETGQCGEHIFDDRGGIIGRGDDCSWRLICPDKLISRRHCVITCEDGAFHVYDASANGLFINDAVEPLGQGNRHVIANGDMLRLGDHVLVAEILEALSSTPSQNAPDAAPPAIEPPSPVTPTTPLDSPSPVSSNDPVPEPAVESIRPAALGHPFEAFSPPAAHIPENWNLELDGLEEDTGGRDSVVQLLDALEPATTRALLDGLGIERRESEEILVEAPTARVMGELLRGAVETVLELQSEYAAVEKRLSGRDVETARSVCGYQDAPALLGALLAERDSATRTRMTHELLGAMRQLKGRHKGMADVLGDSLASVVEQFSPYKGRQRARRRITEPRGLLRRMWRRMRFWVASNGECWRTYERWFESQGGDTYRALNKLFEKKAAALYARRLKPVTDKPEPVREGPQRHAVKWRKAAIGGAQG